MRFPNDIKYTRDHEWIRVNGKEATIGITDFAQGELGDIVFIDISRVGESVNAEEIFGTVEAVKTVSDLFMPVSGKILEFNKGLEQAPDSVNKDPYGDGWMIKVEMSDPLQADKLMTADEYQALVAH
jgi:glycine cleavage system H protein